MPDDEVEALEELEELDVGSGRDRPEDDDEPDCADDALAPADVDDEALAVAEGDVWDEAAAELVEDPPVGRLGAVGAGTGTGVPEGPVGPLAAVEAAPVSDPAAGTSRPSPIVQPDPAARALPGPGLVASMAKAAAMPRTAAMPAAAMAPAGGMRRAGDGAGARMGDLRSLGAGAPEGPP